MPRIAYGAQAYRRDNGNLPELRLINMFLERAPTSRDGVVLLSRKGLAERNTPGSGVVHAVFRKDGVFDGDVFAVINGVLYREQVALGTIVISGPVSIAGRDGEIVIAAGGALYSYDGATLEEVTFPDSAGVSKIIFHDGLFIAARADSQRYYWSAVLDGRTWDALDFASAESTPDNLLDLIVLNDTLWLYSSESIEPWANTGSADAPYQRFEQRIFAKGIIATGCLIELDNALFWVGGDGMAYRLSEVPERISDNGIEERISQSDSVSAFGFTFEGHSFFCIRLDSGTFAFDAATQQWCEFQTYGRGNFRAQCACMSGPDPILGDDENGKLWTFSGYQDGEDTLVRLFTAGQHIEGGTLTIDNFTIEANVGWTDFLAGQGSDPIAEMRLSRDGGARWGDWRAASLGQQGQYRTRTQWRRCGMFDFPGLLAEVRVSDPIGFRISGVLVNEPGGGRARA